MYTKDERAAGGMTIRERQGRDEEARLSPLRCIVLPKCRAGPPISTCDLRTCYQRDRDHHSLQKLSPAEIQDAGVSTPHGRPLPHPA